MNRVRECLSGLNGFKTGVKRSKTILENQANWKRTKTSEKIVNWFAKIRVVQESKPLSSWQQWRKVLQSDFTRIITRKLWAKVVSKLCISQQKMSITNTNSDVLNHNVVRDSFKQIDYSWRIWSFHLRC